MHVNRRSFSVGLAAFGLTGCAASDSASRSGSGRSPTLPDDLHPVRNAEYEAWLACPYHEGTCQALGRVMGPHPDTQNTRGEQDRVEPPLHCMTREYFFT